MNLPSTINTTFQGNAQAFQDSLATVPMPILAALIVVYLILGVLYESYAMVGGLLVSQALTLFTTPVVYIYLDRLSEWLSRGSHSAKSHP